MEYQVSTFNASMKGVLLYMCIFPLACGLGGGGRDGGRERGLMLDWRTPSSTAAAANGGRG